MIKKTSKWLEFEPRLGNTYSVVNRIYKTALGIIQKRKHAWFVPFEGTEFNDQCLRDIAEFMRQLNEEK